jgi:hypothetical protein
MPGKRLQRSLRQAQGRRFGPRILEDESDPQALKRGSYSRDFTARLKSCPSRTQPAGAEWKSKAAGEGARATRASCRDASTAFPSAGRGRKLRSA